MKKFLETLEFIVGIVLVIVAAYLAMRIKQQLGISPEL